MSRTSACARGYRPDGSSVRQLSSRGTNGRWTGLRPAAGIRLLITDSRVGEQDGVACRWAQEWADRLKGRGRHRALLGAERTFAECLSAAGRAAEAKQLLGCVLARCADLNVIRFPIDGGKRFISLIAEVRDDQGMGRRDPMMPPMSVSFLDRILVAGGRGTKAMDEEEKPAAESIGPAAASSVLVAPPTPEASTPRQYWNRSPQIGASRRSAQKGCCPRDPST